MHPKADSRREGHHPPTRFLPRAYAGIGPQHTKAASAERPAPGGGPGSLTVVDNRTGKKYEIKVLGGSFLTYAWQSLA